MEKTSKSNDTGSNGNNPPILEPDERDDEKAPMGNSSGVDHILDYNLHDDNYYYDDFLDSFPKGYRFLPTDEELIFEYLLPKVKNEELPPNRIHEVDVYQSSPDELTEVYRPQGEKTWYFFTSRKRKYKMGKRPNRSVWSGYWKATGSEKPLGRNGVKIGSKRSLVYYKGESSKGEKQSWIMIEYVIDGISRPANGKDYELDDCVLCKIYKKKEDGGTKNNENNDQARGQKTGKSNQKTQLKIPAKGQQVGNQDQSSELEGDSPDTMASTCSMQLENGNNNHTQDKDKHHSIFKEEHVCSASYQADTWRTRYHTSQELPMINGSTSFDPYLSYPNIVQNMPSIISYANDHNLTNPKQNRGYQGIVTRDNDVGQDCGGPSSGIDDHEGDWDWDLLISASFLELDILSENCPMASSPNLDLDGDQHLQQPNEGRENEQADN